MKFLSLVVSILKMGCSQRCYISAVRTYPYIYKKGCVRLQLHMNQQLLNQSVFPLVLLVQSDLGDFLLSHFNRATLSKTGLIVLRKRTDATCPEWLTVISLPMRPFLDLGVRHLV
ncbi:hypothetical protein RND81_07G092900 [Saponaria officinalis]|uniref:Secreted protein n=1 Tax=Saponaria officinalis TaxID=3572 RepID=A0AAW1JSE0_SAPOF